MINFFPSVLNFRGFQFANLTELNAEIALLQQAEPASTLLSDLIKYRSDLLFMVENITMEHLINDIMSSWLNYYIAQQYKTTWTVVFKKDIGFFCFILHEKLNGI
jgi:hypothetical protein